MVDHAMFYTEPTEIIVVSKNPRDQETYEKDTVRIDFMNNAFSQNNHHRKTECCANRPQNCRPVCKLETQGIQFHNDYACYDRHHRHPNSNRNYLFQKQPTEERRNNDFTAGQ